jgi:hypothetical protein
MIARGFRRDRRDTSALRFVGQIVARGRNVSVAIVFEDHYLTRAPKLFLLARARELPMAVAHIEANDRLCYVREEDLVLDPLSARATVALCLIKMGEALDRLVHLDLGADVSAEFAQHWQGARVYVDLPQTFSGAAQLYVTHASSQNPVSVIARDKHTLTRVGLSDREAGDCAKHRTPVHVISVDRDLTFVNGHRAPSTFRELAAWLGSIQDTAVERLVASLTSAWPAPMWFLIHAPNGSVGGRLELPGVLARSIQRLSFLGHALRMWDSKIAIHRISGSRIDTRYVFGRNMNDRPSLCGKRIALVGVGTIGGFLAKFLTQSGAGAAGGRLMLIDNQILEPGNVGRHFLGLPHVGQNKAQAVQEELRRVTPDCEISAVTGDVLERKSDLMQYDMVIDATGERALSDVLNKEFVEARQKRKTTAPILHVWLVGNGVAAQSLLVDGPELACFRCLRLERTDEERFRLLRPDHPATLTPANCGEGAYFAYGVGAPAIAAGLAVQMCLDWANAKRSPRFRTIRVVHDATFEVKDSDVAPREKCPVCGSA